MFPAQVLGLLNHLMKVGFVHSAGIIFELIGPLLRLLDGRTDLVFPLPQSPRARTPSVQLELDMHAHDYGEPITPLLSKAGKL